tara:strand:+ start:4421 stop:4834 length:414 start_codon:yes stop_codon:yes gene_type:complete
MTNITIKIISLSVAVSVSILVAVLNTNTNKKKEIPDNNPNGNLLIKYPNLREILIKKGETFSGCCDNSDYGFFWNCDDVTDWSIEQGGYLLLDKRVILPHSIEQAKIIKTGEHFNWVPCNSRDVTGLTNIPEILIKK